MATIVVPATIRNPIGINRLTSESTWNQGGSSVWGKDGDDAKPYQEKQVTDLAKR